MLVRLKRASGALPVAPMSCYTAVCVLRVSMLLPCAASFVMGIEEGCVSSGMRAHQKAVSVSAIIVMNVRTHVARGSSNDAVVG